MLYLGLSCWGKGLTSVPPLARARSAAHGQLSIPELLPPSRTNTVLRQETRVTRNSPFVTCSGQPPKERDLS